MNEYVQRVLDSIVSCYKDEKEYCQAVKEILSSISLVIDKHPEYESLKILEKLVVPNKIIVFDVTWLDKSGKFQTNKGYRIQFNNAIGFYKGGLRFHPSVNTSILKFLGLVH